MIASLACWASSAGATTLDEAIALLDSGASGTRRLIVKKFDSEAKLEKSVSSVLASLDFVPLFSRNASESLRGYDQIRFEQPLRIDEAKTLLRALYDDFEVEFAYFEPLVDEAVWRAPRTGPRAPLGRRAIPNFEDQQDYLKPSPLGIDAVYAWTLPGGTGAGVRMIDVERGWHSDHQDLSDTFWTNGNNLRVDHGTAVWGEIAAKRDSRGVTGIAHGVEFGTAGVAWNNLMEEYIQASPAVYEEAARQLRAGDILMIEQQATGPDGGAPAPMEFWRANFDVIKSIVDRGVIVVAAAGNGGSDLDEAVYEGAFDLAVRDSGAILVAAAEPPGTRDHHLERLDFSNYGTRIDGFGYGDGVVTTGYGDLYASPDGRSAYTNSFSGTSSATPMIAGAIAILQGVARAQGTVLTPTEVRKALRSTGTRQRGDQTQPIGKFPNFRELLAHFCGLNRLRCD